MWSVKDGPRALQSVFPVLSTHVAGMALKIRNLSYALGAEVCDVDVSKPMSEAFFGEIYQAFLEHGILLFRDQEVTREQHIEFSRRFGELDRHEALPRDRHPEHAELLRVTNRPNPDGSPSDLGSLVTISSSG